MSVSTPILAGNLCSFVAACFTVLSAWSRDRKRIYLYQAAQCLILAIANIFFASPSGTTTFLLCALRNCLIAWERYSGKSCALFVVSVAAVGLLANNRGLVGLIPVVTTAVYTVGCYYVKSTPAIKLNLIVNSVLWTVYDLVICDYVSAAADSVSAVTALVSLMRIRKTDSP